jgi:hypothetical protein
MSARGLTKEEKVRRATIVMQDYGGMLPMAEIFYIHSIIYSAWCCLHSFEEYDLGRKQDDVSADYLVSVVQEAIGHAAALSRYFWPSTLGDRKDPAQAELKKKRGEILRSAFALTEQSPLFNRSLRNAWEHFDERLDAYALESDTGFFFPASTIGSHTLADDAAGHIFKLLDPEAECIVLLGAKYYFAPIRAEVSRILDCAVAADKNGGRLRAEAQTARE